MDRAITCLFSAEELELAVVFFLVFCQLELVVVLLVVCSYVFSFWKAIFLSQFPIYAFAKKRTEDFENLLVSSFS